MNRTTLASLLAAVLIPASAHAQGVTFEVCNVGDVAIDVFLARTSVPAATHIRPATCAEVDRADGTMEEAYVGLAFTDARGQWGAALRFEGIPYMGVKTLPAAVRLALLARGERDPAPVAVLSASTDTHTVQRGNARVSLPMQLLFQPRLPDCKRAVTGRLTTAGRTTGAVEYQTVCENLTYTLKVEGLPDTREMYLGAQPVAGTMSSGLDNDRSPKLPVNFAAEQAERRARDTPAAIEWTDLIAGLKLRAGNLRRADSRAPPDRVVPDYFVVRGTVASVDIL